MLRHKCEDHQKYQKYRKNIILVESYTSKENSQKSYKPFVVNQKCNLYFAQSKLHVCVSYKCSFALLIPDGYHFNDNDTDKRFFSGFLRI